MVLVTAGKRQLFPLRLPVNPPDYTYVLGGLGTGTGTVSAPQPLGTFVVPADQAMRPAGAVSPRQHFTGYAISPEPGHTRPAVPSATVASGPVSS